MKINNLMNNISKELILDKIKTYSNYKKLEQYDIIFNKIDDVTVYSVINIPNTRIINMFLYIGKKENLFYGLPIYNNKINNHRFFKWLMKEQQNSSNRFNGPYLGHDLKNNLNNKQLYNANACFIKKLHIDWTKLYRNMINEN